MIKILNKLIILILFIAIGLFYFNYQIGPYDSNSSKNILIDIPKGSGLIDISDILKDKNVIKNKMFFITLAKITHMDKGIKAGSYNIPLSYSNKEILKLINSGKVYRDIVKVTIPEGYEAHQIAEKLYSEGLVDKDKFLELISNPNMFQEKYSFLEEENISSLEGFLFPDTYFFDKKYSEEVIIDIMLKRFSEVYKEEYKKRKNELGLDLNQFITLASIVEREAKVESERPVISAVFYNRINIDMPLQSCATVQYVLGERKKVLSYEDIRIDSPYNTYKHKGLPPGPISSPGEASIKAVLYPSDTNYLYFVAKKDGSHSFSVNYEDHLKSKTENEKE